MANSPDDARRNYGRCETSDEYSDGQTDDSSDRPPAILDRQPEIPGVRRIRIERQDRSTDTHRTAATTRMTSESYATLPSQKTSSSRSRRRHHHHHRHPEEAIHRGRTSSDSRHASSSASPNEAASHTLRAPTARTRVLSSGEQFIEPLDETPSRVDCLKGNTRRRKIKIVYVTEEEYHSAKQKEKSHPTEKKSRDVPKEDCVRRSMTQRSRKKNAVEAVASSPKRRPAIRGDPDRPTGLRRAQTTGSHNPSIKQHTPSLTTTATNTTSKRPSTFLGNFFGPTVQHHEPEKLVECLTCLSDDIPRSKSAKLKCSHRMCHSCLRRIFKLSVTDPQHMPPKCCTADHIPLKHVERLFDVSFKKNWNRKFQEYSTKNRIYCPARRCGEWIKPGNIHKEDGKRYGKCGRCKTKVCCLCNGKWHGNKECPKDEETNKLLVAAKEAGWQRCYSCRTMVELKEGCNHMTCRCTAEFCMICGLKWKTCNCPWFNYDAVEADRLNHVNAPQPAQDLEAPVPRQRDRIRRQRPNTYNEELTERRRQERLDEEMARRLQNFTMDHNDDYQGGIGDINGIGNGAGHFMNQDYIRAAQNILSGTFDQTAAAANYVMGVRQARGGPLPSEALGNAEHHTASASSQREPYFRAPSPPPMLRRHTMREQAFNAAPSTRPSERVVPRRTRTDYESEAAVHAPYTRRLSGGLSVRSPQDIVPRRVIERPPPARAPVRLPKPSVLAGLGAGRSTNRVNAWRTHVEPGVEPEEGMLSI